MLDLQWRFAAISASARSPLARSFSLLYKSSSRVSVANSWFWAAANRDTCKASRHLYDMNLTFNNSIDRARFLTKSAIDTLGHVDIWFMSIFTIRRKRHIYAPYLVVFLEPSARASLSIVIAWAGQMASQSLQATKKPVNHHSTFHVCPYQYNAPRH